MALQIQKALIAVAFAFLVGMSPLPALAQQGCEPFLDVPVNVIPVFDEAQYNYLTSIAGIRNLSHDNQHSIREGIILGLTRYMPTVQFSSPVRSVTLSDGTTCAHFTGVDVTFGYRDVVVYIAIEIPQGSCGFNEVMAHEQKHIAVNRQILQKYAPLIQQKVAEYLKINGMFREENRDYAISLLNQKIHEIISELGGQMWRENQENQKQVDSVEEYRRITASCDGQLLNIALKAREGLK